MLKNSARNSRFLASPSLVDLSNEKSMFPNPGPYTVLRPRFPNVPAKGNEKAAGFNHPFTDLLAAYGSTPATAFGRWFVRFPFPNVFVPMNTVKGMPLWISPSDAMLQPLTRAPDKPLQFPRNEWPD